MLQQVAINGKELDDTDKLLNKYEHVVVGSDDKVGRTNACDSHRINTGDRQPIRQRLRQVHPEAILNDRWHCMCFWLDLINVWRF